MPAPLEVRCVCPCACSCFLHAYRKALEQRQIDEIGVAANHIVVYIPRSYQRYLRTGFRKYAPERPGIKQPEQKTDVAANESMPILMDRSDMYRDTQLDLGRVGRYVVVATDQTPEPIGDGDQPS